MRILWVSDSPSSPSGFGTVTAAVCRRLAARGHQIEIIGWQNRGLETRWEGIPVHPMRRNMFGSDVLLGYMYRFRPQVLITLADVWWLSFLADPPVQQYLDVSGARWALYYPIDGADADGSLPAGWVRMLQTADIPVAMSRFGVEVSARCGIDAAYVPHGCDLDVFAPPADKRAAKARLGLDDRFVVLSDARNQPRKLLPRTLDIIEAFAADKADVLTYLHCDPDDDAASSQFYSYRIQADIAALGLTDKVRFSQGFRMRSTGGLPPDVLAVLYAASDAHLLCSWGEGFGLPTLQAASAGVVPIAVDYSANSELLGEHGFRIPVESSVVDEFGLVRCLLSREAAVGVLEALYADRALLADRARRSRKFAEAYGWDAIVDLWERVLVSAPPRRRPVRTRSFSWLAGAAPGPVTDLPHPVASAAKAALAGLPEGARVQVRLAERQFGELSEQIRRETYAHGESLTIPVRLAPGFNGAPRAGIGRILVAPGDLPLFVQLLAIFPALSVSVPMTSGDVERAQFLPVEQLLPTLLHYALVVNYAGGVPAPLDLACAALGVPFAGPSQFWPEFPADSPLRAVRALLTDQGLSEWRREVALERASAQVGVAVIDSIRTVALAGQPRDSAEPAAPMAALSGAEMFLVRPRPGGALAAAEEIAREVEALGGLVLLQAPAYLIVMLSGIGKEGLEAHPLVDLVGGISLDDEAESATALKKLLVTNAAQHFASRGSLVGVGKEAY
jgi:glycosyltransferase involved in cell wall biosynthesis